MTPEPIPTETFDHPGAPEVIARILQQYQDRACFTNSFQAEDMVVLHMLRQHMPDIPVLFLETGYHFKATEEFRDRIAEQWKLNLIKVEPQQSVVLQESAFGILHQTDPGRCCHLRKVEPLMRALQEFDLWFTGLRREQSPTRRNLKTLEEHQLPSGKVIAKVSPLAAWDWKQVWQYTLEHGIPYLSLYDEGYRSIGCEPCTSIPAVGADARSGRWGGTKLECGIHTFSKQAQL